MFYAIAVLPLMCVCMANYRLCSVAVCATAGLHCTVYTPARHRGLPWSGVVDITKAQLLTVL